MLAWDYGHLRNVTAVVAVVHDIHGETCATVGCIYNWSVEWPSSLSPSWFPVIVRGSCFMVHGSPSWFTVMVGGSCSMIHVSPSWFTVIIRGSCFMVHGSPSWFSCVETPVRYAMAMMMTLLSSHCFCHLQQYTVYIINTIVNMLFPYRYRFWM